jgi:L-malate glycosyltransferase
MKVLHLNAGNETGGGMHHILLLLNQLNREEFFLGLLEEGEFFQRACGLGIRTTLFQQSSRFDFSIINRIVQFIKENDIDIIHTHGARANFFAPFIAKKANVKWVTTIHSDPRDDFLGRGIKGKLFTYLNLKAIKKADHYFAISERFAELLIQLGIQEEKITTIFNGIDFRQQPVNKYTRRDFSLREDDFVIIMVARLEKVKDHVTAFKALRHVLEKNQRVQLLLVGDGREKEFLVNESKKLNLDGHIKFLGHRNDVMELYPLSDLCLLTSLSESFPLALLEAARAGIPSITTDVGGVRKMIPSPEYGWICRVGDFVQIGNAIIEAMFLQSQSQLHLKGEKFKKHCMENFSIEKQAETIYLTYKKLMKLG